ncbi:MAG: hypothetical protein FWE35_04660 [Streptosporangiales bacterium]|nr:hypothetical protein [Streptosporangiales bacterium]
MTRETTLSNARIVLEEEVLPGSVLIRDGLIADVSPGAGAAGEDLGGDYLLPGLVELHTDHLEHHFTPRPGVRWDPLPAVLASDAQLTAGGATTVLDAVRIGTRSHRPDAASGARQLADAVGEAADAGLLRADHAIHVRCEVSAADCLDAFGSFADDPHVRLVSLMDHTPGQRQYADIEVYRRYIVGKGAVKDSEFDAYVAPMAEMSARYSGPHRKGIAASPPSGASPSPLTTTPPVSTSPSPSASAPGSRSSRRPWPPPPPRPATASRS